MYGEALERDTSHLPIFYLPESVTWQPNNIEPKRKKYDGCARGQLCYYDDHREERMMVC